MIPRSRFTSRKALLIAVFVLAAVAFGTLVELALAHLAHAVGQEAAGMSAAKPQEAKPAASLNQVIDNLRNVIVGLLVGLATLFLTVGGVRYILAGGDPGEVEAAKKTLRYAAIGYGTAVLAPLLVSILKGIVGA
ncbi:pilin [Nonomuraea sp. NPDC049480]|uniref:pilin n=1 Tax=Nonomuraea sp. NPDC049480 TaxID=3364353 RepID=UPI002E60E34A|nr:pilin [Nonomuraea sp.]